MSKIVEWEVAFKPGFHYTANATTTTQKQSDYKVEQSSFTLIALFWLEIGRCRGRNWLNGNQALSPVLISLNNRRYWLKTKRLPEGWLLNLKVLCFLLIIGDFYDFWQPGCKALSPYSRNNRRTCFRRAPKRIIRVSIHRLQIFLVKYEYLPSLQLCEKLKIVFATMCLR